MKYYVRHNTKDLVVRLFVQIFEAYSIFVKMSYKEGRAGIEGSVPVEKRIIMLECFVRTVCAVFREGGFFSKVKEWLYALKVILDIFFGGSR
jgi:hypothetical protein